MYLQKTAEKSQKHVSNVNTASLNLGGTLWPCVDASQAPYLDRRTQTQSESTTPVLEQHKTQHGFDQVDSAYGNPTRD